MQCIYPADDAPLKQGVLGNDNPNQAGGDAAADNVLQSSLNSSTEMVFPFAFTEDTLDPDFWDPNILSTTNWLDAIIDDEFQGLQFAQGINNNVVPEIVTPTKLDKPDSSQQTPRGEKNPGTFTSVLSPTIESNVSVYSGISTETAADICAADEAATRTIGEYYVDGEPARLPRTKRRKLSSNIRHNASPVGNDISFSLHLTLDPAVDLGQRIHIPHAVYDHLLEMWQTTCQDHQLLWPAFVTSEFPLQDVFEHLIGLYFAQFHQTLPFVHPPTFNVSEVSPLLLLAMASVGAHFFQDDNTKFAISLSELVRRSLVFANENPSQRPLDPFTLVQTQILLSITLIYSGDSLSVRRGFEIGHALAISSAEIAKDAVNFLETQQHTTEAMWTAFIQRDRRSRVFYSIWLLDCMWAYQFQKSPMLALKDANLPLPCHEKHWRAASAEEWESLATTISQAPSLKDALQELYIDKRLPRDRGEFARIIMIHGLFQRTWEVDRYYGNPLSHWSPTAKKQASIDILPDEPISLPSIPTYAKWQNSVCDCIDILHWQANATIGQASGLEHPTVAFLHLSRVVLLSPINAIVRYASILSNGDDTTVPEREREAKTIRRWATQSQYKARLGAIHSGVVFWHIRRYSIDAFYEAPAIALAALLLWAFGKFAPRQILQEQSTNGDGQAPNAQHESKGSESPNEASDDSACGIILLDRPTDDELVQQFIRRGHNM